MKGCTVRQMNSLVQTQFGKNLRHFFNRGLQLRWLWLHWTNSVKPWSGMHTACTKLDEDLFRACTFITVGDGKKTSFWKDRWLHGQAPKDIAPLCFRVAWRKNQTVATSMPHNNWMKGLKRMSTQAEIRQFVDLWIQLQMVQLQPQDDQIHWRLTSDGKYSSKSAYEAQFVGAHPDYKWVCVWKAKVENKCEFFPMAPPPTQADDGGQNYQERWASKSYLPIVQDRE